MTSHSHHTDFLLDLATRLQRASQQIVGIDNKVGHHAIDTGALGRELHSLELTICLYDPALQLDNLIQYANHFPTCYEQTRQRPQNYGNSP